MCGITGIISTNTETIARFTADIRRMTQTLAHRGPDGDGFFLNKHMTFGHRRLAIIDLSENGKQPMSYMNRYTITFNGEIYNYLELKEQLLQAGYAFKSNSDTEVVMAAFDCWGKECLNLFNGMWAFVLYDEKENKFLISRDRFGIKPLYYYQDDHHFIFASEIKALLTHPQVTREPNIEYCLAYLQNGPKEYIKETAFKNIYRITHASFVHASLHELLTSPIQETTYWSLTAGSSYEKYNPDHLKEYADQYYELLKSAVSLRLRADVKVGSALSGGLDSSSIVKLINDILKENDKRENQETFSCVYPSPATKHCDESDYINTIARHLQVNSNQIEPHSDNIIAEYHKMIYYFDTPPDSTCLSGWFTFKCVANSTTTVTLDGQGADEQLAGYPEYVQYYLATTPHSLRQAFSFLSIPDMKRFVYKGAFLGLLKACAGPKTAQKIIHGMLRKKYSYEDLNHVLVQHVLTTLITLIHYSDRASMAFSIESRMPFMDYRLIEFLATVPATYKMFRGWTKYLARFAMDNKLPDSVTWRKDKMGWPIPEDFWFRQIHREWFCNIIEKSPFLKELHCPLNVRDAIKDPAFSMTRLIRHLNLAVWHDIFFNPDNNYARILNGSIQNAVKKNS